MIGWMPSSSSHLSVPRSSSSIQGFTTSLASGIDVDEDQLLYDVLFQQQQQQQQQASSADSNFALASSSNLSSSYVPPELSPSLSSVASDTHQPSYLLSGSSSESSFLSSPFRQGSDHNSAFVPEHSLNDPQYVSLTEADSGNSDAHSSSSARFRSVRQPSSQFFPSASPSPSKALPLPPSSSSPFEGLTQRLAVYRQRMPYYIPCLQWGATYTRDQLWRDMAAGITVGIMALTAAIAYVPPQSICLTAHSISWFPIRLPAAQLHTL
jgi:hypothetical protein